MSEDDGHCDQSRWIALLDAEVQELKQKIELILDFLKLKVIE